jgi:hypothetical protein
MQALQFSSKLSPASCEERLLDPSRSRPFELWTVRDGEILVRDMRGLWWNRLGAFFRVSLRSREGGTQVDIRSDGPLAVKIFAAIWLAGVGGGACLTLCIWILEAFGIRRGTGSPAAGFFICAVMFAGGIFLFRGGRGSRDLRAVAEFVRREVDPSTIGGAAEPAVAADRA